MEIWFIYSSIFANLPPDHLTSHRQQYTHTHTGFGLKWPTYTTLCEGVFYMSPHLVSRKNDPRKMAAFWLTLHQDRIHVAFQSQTTHLLCHLTAPCQL